MTAITYKKGAAFSVALTAACKVFSFISSLLLAYFFGADSTTDVYFYLILLSALLNGWLQGINTGIVVPEFMHVLKKDKNAAADFVNFFLYIYFIIAFILVLVCFVFPQQSLGFISAFDSEQIERGAHLMGLSALYFSSFFIMSFLISVVECFKLFSIYFLSPLNTFLPLLLLLTTRRLESMFAGYIFAYVIQIIACVIMLKKSKSWPFRFKMPSFGNKFKQNILFFQPNNIAWAAVMYAPLFMVSSTAPGMVSAVNYSRMLADSPVDIFVSKVDNVSKVKLTVKAAENDRASMADTLKRTDIALMIPMLPFCIFSAVFSFDIIKMFFMRGNFTLQAAHDTAIFLLFSILAVPFYTLNNNMANLFSAIRLVKEITLRYFVYTIIFILLFVVSIKIFGAFAYPVVFLLLYAVRTVLNAITVNEYCPEVKYGPHLLYMAKLTVLCFVCAILTKYLFSFYDGNVFIKIFINGSFFVAVTALLFWLDGDFKKFKETLNITNIKTM